MKNIYGHWRRITEKIGSFQVNAIFSLLYFLLFAPVGFFVSRFQDLLGREKPPSWERAPDNVSTLAKLREQ